MEINSQVMEEYNKLLQMKAEIDKTLKNLEHIKNGTKKLSKKQFIKTMNNKKKYKGFIADFSNSKASGEDTVDVILRDGKRDDKFGDHMQNVNWGVNKNDIKTYNGKNIQII